MAAGVDVKSPLYNPTTYTVYLWKHYKFPFPLPFPFKRAFSLGQATVKRIKAFNYPSSKFNTFKNKDGKNKQMLHASSVWRTKLRGNQFGTMLKHKHNKINSDPGMRWQNTKINILTSPQYINLIKSRKQEKAAHIQARFIRQRQTHHLLLHRQGVCAVILKANWKTVGILE